MENNHPGHRDHRAGDGGEQSPGTGRTGTEEQRPALNNMQVNSRVDPDQDGGQSHCSQDNHCRYEPEARPRFVPPMV